MLQGKEADSFQQADERITPRDIDALQQDEYLQAADQLRCIEAGYKKARKLLAVALPVPSQKLEMKPTANYQHQANRKHEEEVVLSPENPITPLIKDYIPYIILLRPQKI